MTLTIAAPKPQTNKLDFKLDTEVLVVFENWKRVIKKPSVFCSKIILEICKLSRAKSEYKRGSHLEVSIVFADDKFVKNLNMLYRNVNRPTNVLAFPTSDPQNPQCVNDVKHKLLGDIVVSFETIKKENAAIPGNIVYFQINDPIKFWFYKISDGRYTRSVFGYLIDIIFYLFN